LKDVIRFKDEHIYGKLCKLFINLYFSSNPSINLFIKINIFLSILKRQLKKLIKANKIFNLLKLNLEKYIKQQIK